MTLLRICEDLRGLGYEGGYDAVRRYASSWRRRGSTGLSAAFVPLSIEPGEAYQFDWSHEVVLIDGVTVTVKVAHMRLCHSRMPFVRAYPRETQEMVFDARGRTIWEVFEAERPSLVPYRRALRRLPCRHGVGVQDLPRALRQQQALRPGQRRRSPGGGARLCRAHQLRQDGRIVGEHARAFGRGGTVYNPWHYVPVLVRKPGALRNGAPFKHWVLPAALERVRRKLRAAPDGDRQMVEILGAVLSDGLPAVEAACASPSANGPASSATPR